MPNERHEHEKCFRYSGFQDLSFPSALSRLNHLHSDQMPGYRGSNPSPSATMRTAVLQLNQDCATIHARGRNYGQWHKAMRSFAIFVAPSNTSGTRCPASATHSTVGGDEPVITPAHVIP